MPSAIVVQIADQVVADLNSVVLSQPFTAARRDVIVSRMEQLETLQVSVIPGVLEASVWDLNRRLAFGYELGIWVQQRTDMDPALNDALRLLVEEIITLFLGQVLAGVGAVCTAAATRDTALPVQFDVTRTFTAGIFFTFRQTQ